MTADLSGLTRDQLREIARERGLPVSGRKAEIRRRIEADRDRSDDEPDEPDESEGPGGDDPDATVREALETAAALRNAHRDAPDEGTTPDVRDDADVDVDDPVSVAVAATTEVADVRPVDVLEVAQDDGRTLVLVDARPSGGTDELETFAILLADDGSVDDVRRLGRRPGA